MVASVFDSLPLVKACIDEIFDPFSIRLRSRTMQKELEFRRDHNSHFHSNEPGDLFVTSVTSFKGRPTIRSVNSE